MTFRDNPILPVVAAGVPPEENHTNWRVNIAAALEHRLRTDGIPIRGVFAPFESAVHWAVVSVDDGHLADVERGPMLRAIGKSVFGSRAGNYIPKVIVVGEGIDPTDTAQVVWAFATNNRPGEEILYPDTPTIPLVAYLTDGERSARTSTKAAVYDAIPPSGGGGLRRVASFADYPEDLRERILQAEAAS
jgi:UbiD family decarboxylase